MLCTRRSSVLIRLRERRSRRHVYPKTAWWRSTPSRWNERNQAGRWACRRNGYKCEAICPWARWRTVVANLLPTNSRVVRKRKHHCDNNELVELSVLRYKEQEV